jgi:transcriptional regulator with PAS, ATPase and Fis domain
MAKIDVRFLAATNQDLEPLIERRAFRQDLFFRLNVGRIYLPSLRERWEDILELFAYFIRQFNTQYRRGVQAPMPELASRSPSTIGRGMSASYAR